MFSIPGGLLVYPISFSVCMSVCIDVCLFIALPYTSTLGGGDVNEYFIIAQPNLTRNIGLLGIIGFTILILHGDINH